TYRPSASRMGRPVMMLADARDCAVSTLMSRLVCSRSRSVSEMLSRTSARFPPTRTCRRIAVTMNSRSGLLMRSNSALRASSTDVPSVISVATRSNSVEPGAGKVLGQRWLALGPSTLAQILSRRLEQALDELARRGTRGSGKGSRGHAFLAHLVQGPEENQYRRGHGDRDDRLRGQRHL